MRSNQRPIGTAFSASSTAGDVLAGIDLTGKNVIITGGHAGIGLACTRAFVAAGAAVTVAARSPERAADAVAGIDPVEVAALDLVDPASIDAFVARWLATARPVHVLVNCAAFTPAKEVVRDTRGYEAQLSTNHLGHFQLTLGLHPVLRAAHGARVVNVSSGAQRFGEIRWDDPRRG